MALIRKETLIEHLNACLAESDGKTPITDAVIVAIRCAVEQMPEVDAVPVVRCADCKCFNFEYPNYRQPWGICEKLEHCAKDADNYCKYGERREDNG